MRNVTNWPYFYQLVGTTFLSTCKPYLSINEIEAMTYDSWIISRDIGDRIENKGRFEVFALRNSSYDLSSVIRVFASKLALCLTIDFIENMHIVLQ